MEQEILIMFYTYRYDIEQISRLVRRTQHYVKNIIDGYTKNETENFIILPSKLNDM